MCILGLGFEIKLDQTLSSPSEGLSSASDMKKKFKKIIRIHLFICEDDGEILHLRRFSKSWLHPEY